MQRKRKKTDINLLPGQFYVGCGGQTIRTLLGSCVSITLWHPERKVGAMSHFLLSSRDARRNGKPDARYAAEALELMLDELKSQGIAPEQCQAKIFGGGRMFPAMVQDDGGIGRQNGEVARELLRSKGIPIVAEHLYGMGHRHIVFDIDSGDVWSRQTKPGGARMPSYLLQFA